MNLPLRTLRQVLRRTLGIDVVRYTVPPSTYLLPVASLRWVRFAEARANCWAGANPGRGICVCDTFGDFQNPEHLDVDLLESMQSCLEFAARSLDWRAFPLFPGQGLLIHRTWF
jgi:hypothetical protein